MRSLAVLACFLAVAVLAKKTPEEKQQIRDEKAAAKLAAEKEKLLQVFVSEPYLELATGPGRGYPVFHVVEREQSVDVLYRRTDWFKVRDEQGVEGWARARDMRRTKLADGTPFVFKLGDREGFTSHDWELGIGGGDYGGANLISAYGALFAHRQHEGRDLAVAVPGQLRRTATRPRPASPTCCSPSGASRRSSASAPAWSIPSRAPPSFCPHDRTDQTAYAGAGLRFYLTRRFFVRADYRWHTIFTSRDDNQELEEWKVHNRLLLLTGVVCASLMLGGCASLPLAVAQGQTSRGTADRPVEAAEEEAEDQDVTPPRVIEPNVARRKIKTPKIDNENWEVGGALGFVSIEDFGTSPTYAVQLTYHVTEDFFFRGDLGQSTAGEDEFRDVRRQHRAADRR